MGFGKAKTSKDGTRPWETRGRGEARLWYRQDEARVEQSQTGQNRASRAKQGITRQGRTCQSKYLPIESGRVGKGEFMT